MGLFIKIYRIFLTNNLESVQLYFSVDWDNRGLFSLVQMDFKHVEIDRVNHSCSLCAVSGIIFMWNHSSKSQPKFSSVSLRFYLPVVNLSVVRGTPPTQVLNFL